MVRGITKAARGRALVCACCVLALAHAPNAFASIPDLFGFGGRSSGMAGAGVATAENYEALYLNPGGLAAVRRARLDLGAVYADLNLEIDGRVIDNERPLATMIAAVAPLNLGGVLKDRIAIGFSALVPTAVVARADSPITGEPTFALLEHRAQVLSLQAGLGVTITDELRVGIAILGLAALGGDIFVSADGSGGFSSRSEQSMLARFAPVIGVQYALPTVGIDLGIVFRAESDASFVVNVENDLIDELPLTVPPLNIGGTAQYDPLTVAVEAAWHATNALSLSAYLAYHRWSEFESPTINPVQGKPAVEDPNFRDTVVPRIAAEWFLRRPGLELAFRAGYSFVMTPAPVQTGTQSLLDNHRNIGSLGLGISFPGRLPLFANTWFQYHHLNSRGQNKDPSTPGYPNELPYTAIDTGGRIVAGGLTMGVEL